MFGLSVSGIPVCGHLTPGFWAWDNADHCGQREAWQKRAACLTVARKQSKAEEEESEGGYNPMNYP